MIALYFDLRDSRCGARSFVGVCDACDSRMQFRSQRSRVGMAVRSRRPELRLMPSACTPSLMELAQDGVGELLDRSAVPPGVQLEAVVRAGDHIAGQGPGATQQRSDTEILSALE